MKLNTRYSGASKITLVAVLSVLGIFAGQAFGDIKEQQINADALERTGQWHYQIDGKAGLWLGYYDLSRSLHLRDPKGEDRILVPQEPGRTPSGLAMAALPEGVSTLWRQKFPTKSLYLGDSNTPEKNPLVLGEGTEPLTRLKAVNMGDTLHLLWYGEAGDPLLKIQYFVFYQNVNPRTNEMSAVERVTPGIYPVWTYDKAENILVFSWIEGDKSGRIIARTKRSEGGEFGPPVTIAEVPTISWNFQAFRSGERWFVVWETRYEKNRVEGAFSDDLGQTWKRFGFDDLGDFLIGSLVVDTDDEGRIYMALSGSDLANPSHKQDVRLIRSADRGDNWVVSRPRPVAIGQKFRGRNPSITLGPQPGQLLLVWEDWRNLRGQLFASLSYDGGQTWKYDNIPLPQPPGINRGMPDQFSASYYLDQTYHVIAQQPTDDGYGALNLFEVTFSPSDLEHIAAALPKPKPAELPAAEKASMTASPAIADAEGQITDPQQDALRQRVESFWKSMISKDFDGAYRFQDPFYRAKMKAETYRKGMGRIVYTDVKVDAIEIEGPIATVKTRVMASVPPFRAGTGEMISRPEKEINITETWLWVDGDWYREYYSEYMDKKFTIH
jgi:hypothetical protein